MIKKDKNLYEAINRGIEISNGKVISLLHAGDYYFNKFVKDKRLSFAEKKCSFILVGIVNDEKEFLDI